MAITRHLAELILTEHKHRSIHGEVLLLGRQLVLMTPDEAQALVEKTGIRQPKNAFIDYDKTPHPYPKKLISDSSFFSLFSDANVRACDVSAYEGAEIIFNLSERVPDVLLGGFDFIYNGSVLDNVFDPAACIRNTSRMLRPHGRVFNYEGAAHVSPAYLKFSPDWFFDYYALNDFADCQVYVVTYDDVHLDPWEVFQFDPFTADGKLTMPMRLPTEAMVVAIAENAPIATVDKAPLQNVYRSAAHEVYRVAAERFQSSPRRDSVRQIFNRSPAVASWKTDRRWLLSKFTRRQPSQPSETLQPGHTHLGTLGSPNFLADR
jgi:hypothetical protein